jgi:hypothetical protein
MDSGLVVGDRHGERRRDRHRLVLRERRTGFDRRERGAFVRGLTELRDSPATLLTLLVAVNVMNVLDQVATTRALAIGFTEGNPVMAALIAFDPRFAAVVKITAVLAVTTGIWSLRRYRLILQVGVFMFAAFAFVMLVHFYGAAFYY